MKVLTKYADIKNDSAQTLKTKLFPSLNVGVIPALIVAVLPKCPLCLAAYLSVLGFVGISPLQYSSWILPLTIFFSAVTLFIFFRQAKRNANYFPFFLGLFGLTFISLGKFYFGINLLTYIGAGILIISAIWLSKMKRLIQCSKC